MKRFVVGLLVGLLFAAVPASAEVSKWSWFEKTDGTSKVDSVKVWTRCLNEEDSAAHLKLVRYGDGTVVYGCYRGGY